MLVDGKEVCGFCRTTGKPPIICLKAHMRRLYRIQCRQQSKPHQKRLRQCKSPKSRTNFAPKKCAKKQKTTSNKPPKEEYQDVIAFSDLMEISDLEDSFDSSGSQIDEIGLKLFSPLKFLEVVSDLDLRVCKFIQFKSSKLSSNFRFFNSFLFTYFLLNIKFFTMIYYLFMQLPCVIMRDDMFFAGIFTFLVCFRFKLKNHNNKKHIVPNYNTRWLDL